jgi:argonaute-like protein implicated in RNA metabolism and viral defense
MMEGGSLLGFCVCSPYEQSRRGTSKKLRIRRAIGQ